MGAPTGVDVEAIKKENEDLRQEIEDLRKQVQSLTEQARFFKPSIFALFYLFRCFCTFFVIKYFDTIGISEHMHVNEYSLSSML